MISDFGGSPLDGSDDVAIVADGQLITVSKVTWGSSRPVDLVEFTLLIGMAGELDPASALARNGEIALGAFMDRAGAIWWRHATPLETLDVLEAQLPLAFAHGIAAQMASHGSSSPVTHQNTGTMWH